MLKENFYVVKSIMVWPKIQKILVCPNIYMLYYDKDANLTE
jgi:hypothetical protein